MDKAIQYMVDYVEGRMDINEFKNHLKNDPLLKKELTKRFDFGYVAYDKYNNNVYDYLMSLKKFKEDDWDNYENRFDLYLELIRWLKWFEIPYDDSFTKYKDDFEYILDIQPTWLQIIDDQGIFEKIIAEVPQGLTKTKRIQWGKSRVKELFRYDKTYPRWIQAPEWPIVNGKPLVFSRQKRAGKDDVRTYYYFYDPETGEETIVTKFY